MTQRRVRTMDGNEAVASVAYRSNEVISIYPITPASPMAELCDEWASATRPNVWGSTPRVIEMQSEGGAAGAVHGALQAGALATTFTSSQGLLLMIPNLYKIAGELTSFCMHVAARTVATHALSIFGDHSDVMACRQTGVALLCSNSVQEAHDFAAIAQAATLVARVPILHFFDGFRTSHEIAKITELADDDLRALYDEEAIAAHRRRALTPDNPMLRGTAQNEDTFFQAREAANRFHAACPAIVQGMMDRLAARTGRRYRLFDYVGHPEAERVVILMGSGAEAAHESVDRLTASGEKVGILKVRLFRPLAGKLLVNALPSTTRAIAVLDRTKEPGAPGEPLYLDVIAALAEARAEGETRFVADPRVVGGRYGLSGKEFSPAMIKAVFDNLKIERPRNHFTVGIRDDVTGTSLSVDESFDREGEDVVRAVFFGLGSDGTVGSNKNTIKIIGEETELHAQAYFVYDSKKSGAVTVSHLRFGPKPIRSTYRIRKAGFVACHQPQLLDRLDVLELAETGGTFLLNTHHAPAEVWDALPREVQEILISRRLKFYVIDAKRVAEEAGLGGHVSTIMQACFFALCPVLPRDEAIQRIKDAIQKTFQKRGADVVKRNHAAVDSALAHLHEVKVPSQVSATRERPRPVPEEAPSFVTRVTAMMLAGKGDLLPVSAFPVDGTWPVGTAKWEKRGLAAELPQWEHSLCIQCNKCALICPHAAIRAKVFQPEQLASAPAGFLSMDYKAKEFAKHKYAIQVAPEDCTGCELCAKICPASDKQNPDRKALYMAPAWEHRQRERENFAFFDKLPEPNRRVVQLDVKGSQFLEPLFEFSGACSGCGETPYIKLLTQLFGDRSLIANATGCSSIYGGNLPTTPYRTNAAGCGPAWSNSLFEDNAEFGVGFRLAVDSHAHMAAEYLRRLAPMVGDTLAKEILGADQSTEAGLAEQRERVRILREKLATVTHEDARRLETLSGYLVRKTVWIVGGDGWAYDIGYGGLDHVLASREDVNILVLDTEVYSNTGGQQSKATPFGASAKFAASGKTVAKKDLALLAMTYGNAYVATVALGAKDVQTFRAFREAESYPGPSLIIAYSHCIAHGYDLTFGVDQQRLAVETGAWPLFRFDPRRLEVGEPPLKLDSGPPRTPIREFLANEGRFKFLEGRSPERYQEFLKGAEQLVARRWALYDHLKNFTAPVPQKS
ncbi:MAG: pyruvate:ferredoxin (flavodoxin) oxidoreductase [Deltaproteobacteria bacterium]|nr:pyruvate:ferredoxin (flavodoxin) oxidoreductase [Deltaproteobacteria bacterium]